MRPKSDKENKANSFILWDDAHSHSVSVCEQYISMSDICQTSLTGENTLHVTFPVIIGFENLLLFQNCGDYPSCVLGDFKLHISISPDVFVWCSLNPIESILQMAEVYLFTENDNHEIFNYKQFANILSSTQQQNNYDHRFTQVNSFGKAATNCVANYYTISSVFKIASYEGVDILLKPRLINTYLAQSIIIGYKLQSGYMEHIYKLYQSEPFAVPAEIIYSNNFGAYPYANGIDATKQFKFINVKEVCILFPRHVSDVWINYVLVCLVTLIPIKKPILLLLDFSEVN
jgi:hypothetical protein